MADKIRTISVVACPSALASMNNLAQTLKAQGDLAVARKLEEQALEPKVRLLGKEHPDTLMAMNDLAQTLKVPRGGSPNSRVIRGHLD
jgi:hypothetical protein